MAWLISFIISWILFFLLIDYRQLRRNILGGFLVLALASFIDWGGQHLELYAFHDLIIPWAGCSAFYKWGPVFTIGTVFAQYVPKTKWMQALNIFVVSLLFLALENLVIRTGTAEYIHWHMLASFTVDILSLCSLTWFTVTFIRKNRTA
ncbi:MAG: hypothetical protein ACOYVK_07060 [Bacillota bacterium]